MTMNKKQYGLLAVFFSIIGLISLTLSVLPGFKILFGVGCVLLLGALPLYGVSSTYKYY